MPLFSCRAAGRQAWVFVAQQETAARRGSPTSIQAPPPCGLDETPTPDRLELSSGGQRRHRPTMHTIQPVRARHDAAGRAAECAALPARARAAAASTRCARSEGHRAYGVPAYGVPGYRRSDLPARNPGRDLGSQEDRGGRGMGQLGGGVGGQRGDGEARRWWQYPAQYGRLGPERTQYGAPRATSPAPYGPSQGACPPPPAPSHSASPTAQFQ